MRLAAFDPRVRTLNGMARLSAFDPRVRTLNGLRGLGCSCQQPPPNLGRVRALPRRMRGLARLGRFGRLGQGDEDFSDAENIFLQTGYNPAGGTFDTTSVDPGGTLIAPGTFDPGGIAAINLQQSQYNAEQALNPSTSSAPIGVITNPTITPQQALAQQYYGTTNLTSLTPAQTAAINSAAPLNAAGSVLTSAQVAALQAAQAPGSAAAGTFFGIPTSYLVWGGIGFAALMVLSAGKRR